VKRKREKKGKNKKEISRSFWRGPATCGDI